MCCNSPDKKYRLRAYYKKSGRLAYLSHLETIRAVESIVRRANVPFAVTNGFSPHMKISFGLALGVGVSSQCEKFDIYLTEYVDCEQKLIEASLPDLNIYKCEYIDNDEPSLGSVDLAQTYCVELDNIGKFEIPSTIQKKRKEVIVKDYLLSDVEVENNKVIFTLKSGPKGSINPVLFIQSIFKESKIKKVNKCSESVL